jgi:serine/threonine protein kinase
MAFNDGHLNEFPTKTNIVFSANPRMKINLKAFDKVKRLGKGSFGETFLYRKGNYEVAVKELKGSSNARVAIDNEIAVLKRLGVACNKFNILCFQQVEEYPASTYIITEYIHGKELFYVYEDMLQENIHEYCRKIGIFYTQLAKAVKYIHFKKVVHYDIKPENIMIDTRTLKLKLIDFGLARIGYPKIEMSGYTREYAPLYYYTQPRRKWDFNEAKTVDAYCLASTFYEPYSNYRPLGVVLKILDYFIENLSEKNKNAMKDLLDTGSDIETICTHFDKQMMPSNAYEYLLSLKKEFFKFDENLDFEGNVGDINKYINDKLASG